MDTLFNLLIAPLQETFFQKSLIGGSVVAVVSGVVGCLVVLRRMSFLGDALSHALIAGVAGGYLFMKLLFGIEAHAPAMLIGSLIAAVLTVVLIGFVSRVSRIEEDTAIGIMFTGVFAAGVVVVSIFRNYIHIDLMHFIMGDVLGVADADLWASTIISAAVLTVILLFFRYCGTSETETSVLGMKYYVLIFRYEIRCQGRDSESKIYYHPVLEFFSYSEGHRLFVKSFRHLIFPPQDFF